MEQRIITKLNHQTSRLGMGLMRLPTTGDTIDYPTAEGMIDTLMANGVTYYDTAWFYHNHTSEDFAKKALISRYPRDKFTIATKMPVGDVNKPEDGDRIFAKQCENLGVDFIDFYLLHGIDLAGWQKCKDMGLDTRMNQWKQEGKIRYKGFSFHGATADLAPILDDYKPDFVQIQLNYYDWIVGDAQVLYKAVADRKVPLIVMEPVRGGGLARFNETVNRVFEETGKSAASYALRWCAALDGVDVVLSGMTTPEQVADNLATFKTDAKLDNAGQSVIDRAMEQYRTLPLIPCTSCKYCIECPQKINIPWLFSSYNEKIAMGGSWLLENYEMLVPAGQRVGDCIECGACEAKCPQKIGIIAEMKRVMAETQSPAKG